MARLHSLPGLRPRRASLNADECAHHFNAYLAAVLPAYGRDASTCDCHLIPQVAYIHGRGGAAGGLLRAPASCGTGGGNPTTAGLGGAPGEHTLYPSHPLVGDGAGRFVC